MNISIDLQEAEKTMIQCSERHVDCMHCTSQQACQRAWDGFIDRGTNGFDAAIPHVIRFKEQIARLEKRAYATTGMFCFAAGTVFVSAFIIGTLHGIVS